MKSLPQASPMYGMFFEKKKERLQKLGGGGENTN